VIQKLISVIVFENCISEIFPSVIQKFAIALLSVEEEVHLTFVDEDDDLCWKKYIYIFIFLSLMSIYSEKNNDWVPISNFYQTWFVANVMDRCLYRHLHASRCDQSFVLYIMKLRTSLQKTLFPLEIVFERSPWWILPLMNKFLLVITYKKSPILTACK